MVKAQGNIVIDRPVDDVFAFIADGANGPQWLAALQIARCEPEGATQLGTRIYEERKYGSRTIYQVAEVTELVNYRFHKKLAGGPMDVDDLVICRSLDAGARTDVSQILVARPKGALVLATPFLGSQLKRDIDRSLRQLKETLEGKH